MNRKRMLVLLDQMVFSGSSFLITFLMARWLDMEAFGRYSGFVLFSYLLISGIGAFTIQPLQVLAGRFSDRRAYHSFTFGLQLMAGLLVLLAGSGLHLLFPASFPLALPLFAAGFLLHDFGRRMLLATDKIAQTLLLDLVVSGLSLLLLITLQAESRPGLNTALARLTWPYLASFALMWWFIRPLRPARRQMLVFGLQHWRSGKWLFLTAVSQWWSGNLLVVASGVYLGHTALGALRLAQSFMGVLNILLQTFENHLLPQTAIRMRSNTAEGMAYLSGTSKSAALLFLPLLAIIYFLAEPIMVLAGGAGYAPYAFALKGMALLYVLVFIGQPVRLAIRAALLHRHFFGAYLLSLGFAILFAHTLLSGYGLNGAIAGLAISQCILLVYWSIVLHQKNIPLWKSFISS